ncbi:MAG: hypothetical protein Q9226_003060 [Calogaya cf. arnoldii]
MDWNKWSGFVGNGTYVAINRASSHRPHDRTQLWYIWKTQHGGEAYSILNLEAGRILTASGNVPTPNGDSHRLMGAKGPEDPLVGLPIDERPAGSAVGQCPEQLWAIDRGILATEKGKMVVFRSLEYPASVIDLDRGDNSNGTVVSLRPERRKDEHREPQKWLLQIQREYGDGCPQFRFRAWAGPAKSLLESETTGEEGSGATADGDSSLKAAKRMIVKTFEGGDSD